ncbi:MAG: AMP-binding protein [Proteobacteria bacterium]|nr:AMP-binding protein [Pseudomonadota bacterium]
MNNGCNRAADFFLEMGARKGQVCAVMLETGLEYAMAVGGLSKIGVVSSLVNTNLGKKSLTHLPAYAVISSETSVDAGCTYMI